MVFVINLTDRTDRRAAMEQQLSNVGWKGEFFPGIRPASKAGFETIGARGSFLSHLVVLKDAQKREEAYTIILEDDLNFCDGFQERWNEATAFLECQKWSIFLAGHSLDGPSGIAKLSPETGFIGAHFIVIERNAVAPLVDGLEAILARPPGHPDGGPMYIDGAYSTLRKQNPSLATFASFPPLGYQRSSRSDVAKLKWMDKIHSLRPVIDYARRLKNSLRTN
jgi:glycosyl transferase, family 25